MISLRRVTGVEAFLRFAYIQAVVRGIELVGLIPTCELIQNPRLCTDTVVYYDHDGSAMRTTDFGMSCLELPFSLLTFLIDLLTEMFRNDLLNFVVVHELGEQLFVLVHPVDEHVGECAVEL